jgi:tetratricopeptide (TPR) repeat protein
MGREDWHSRSTWSQRDQEEFWARLKRSRGPYYRAGYLRIQAYYLEQAGILDPAVELLEHALREDAESEFPDAAQIEHQLATCREKQRRLPEAIEHVRRALAAEEKHPNSRTSAWLTFGRIAVEHDMHQLYGEALAIIERHADQSILDLIPLERYEHAAILAIIAAHRGDRRRARELAEAALDAAGATRSGFAKHPKVGLVTDRDTRLYERVLALARDR